LKSLIGFNFVEVYAILAKKLLKKGFSKVLCGKDHSNVINELKSSFKTIKLKLDPRKFEVKNIPNETVYTDFDPNNSYDLSDPNFKVPNIDGIIFITSSNLNQNIFKITIPGM
jgi:hypothetical protein